MATIRIQERAGGTDEFQATISFNNGPEYALTINDPFAKEEDDQLAWYFEGYLRFPFTDRVKAREAAGSIARYGESLFKQVFEENHNVYARYKAAVQAGPSTMQFEIAGSPLFHTLHWEALKDPEIRLPLALQATMVRKNLNPSTIEASVRPSPTINLLIVTARPSGRSDVGYRTISRPLVEALRQANLPVQIDILRPGTYKALEKQQEGYYQVIHFDLHGSVLTYGQLQQAQEASRHLYNERYGRSDIQPYEGVKAFLAFEGAEDTQVDLVEASELTDLLVTHQVPVAILNACQSGKQIGASETSLGSRLMQAGVQLVLAMGYSVTVSAAELLMQTLYQHLFAGEELSAAIRHARTELYNHKARQAYFEQQIDLEDWLLPVVYQNQPVQVQPREFTPGERAAWFERKAEEQRYSPPEPHYGFVGRDLDILEIERRLLLKRNLLLVRGMGGAGKTTLLRHLGAWWRSTGFVERVFYFGYDEQAWTLEQLMMEMAQELYGPQYYTNFLQPLSLAARRAMLTHELRATPHLLILDNLESITGAELAIQHTLLPEEPARLRSFLADLAKGRTLVLLGSRGGEDWLAKGTFDNNVYELPGLDPEAASTLADRILEKYHVTKYREETDFQKLLKLLDGFPLALEVILANLAHQAPGEVLAALQAGDVKLDTPGSQEKTESILRCIDYSHSNLSPEAQQLLLCLAPFTSVIWLNPLNYYTEYLPQQPALASLPFERWPEVLREAQNWGLLSPDPDIPSFLRLQPIFPYFLRNRLQEPAQAEVKQAVDSAFREYYQRVGATLNSLLSSQDAQQRQTGQLLAGLEYENLVTALTLALEAQASIAGYYEALLRYLTARQDPRRALALFQTILDRFERYPAEKLAGPLGFEFAKVLGSIANWQLHLKQYAAESSYQKLLQLVLQLGQLDQKEAQRLQATTYHQLGRVAQEQRQWKQAEQYFQQALRLKIEFNDRYSQASTYHQLGTVAQEQRQWKQAEQYFQQALQLKSEFNDRHGQAKAYHQLGWVAQEQRQWEQAEQYFQQALQLKSEFNDHYSQASTYHQLGRVAEEQRQFEQAKQYYQQALQLKSEYNDRYSQASTYHNLGIVAQEQRQFEQAEHYYQQALQLKIEYNDRYGQASTYHQLGRVAQEQRQFEQAERYYQQALQLFIEYNDRYRQTMPYHQLGIVAQQQRQWKQAEQYLQQALQICVEFNGRYNQAGTYQSLGVVAQKQGQWEQAEQYYQQALQLFIEYNDRYSQVSTYHNLGILEREREQWAPAREYLLRALEISVDDQDHEGVDSALYNLALLWQSSHDAELPAAIATMLGASRKEIEARLRKYVE